MVAQFQRKTIGKAARFGHLILREIAPRQGHAKAIARRARHIGAPGDFHLAIARNRPRSAGQRLLESVERGLISHA